MKDDDFGFSFVSEEEMRKQEEALKKQLNQVQITTQGKLEGLYDMFKPLLNKLESDPEKNYIKWPGDQRKDRLREFRKRVETYIQENK